MADTEFFNDTHWHAEAGLSFDALACMRGLSLVFENISAKIDSGQALALYGANGSGKTSLLRLVAGLLPPHAGCILPAPQPQQSHYLAHMDGLKNLLTVAEMLAHFGASFTAGAYDGDEVLTQLGLAGRAGQKIGDLSAGQRRRLTFARLLIAPRRLWLLDEPMTALDEQGRDFLNRLAAAHLAVGGLIIAASHEKLAFATDTLTLDSQAQKGAA